MRGLLNLSEGKKTNAVRLAHFFGGPTDGHVTRQSSAAIGRPLKGGKMGLMSRLRMHDCTMPFDTVVRQ
jgi:hypothetical protein